jgi:branched-chain amino acid transport system ATP-binding protein
MTAILQLRGLSAAYGAVRVLHNIDLDVATGGVTALLGANGAGKTTLLRCVSNALVSRNGSIRFEGERIDHLRTERIARLGIAHVPDGRGTFPPLTVEENLRVGAIGRRGAPASVQEDLDRVYDLFPKLTDLRKRAAGLLSGGEQQMLAIGRALMLRPRLLLLDEPSFGLAPIVVRHIFQMLARVCEQSGLSILVVEQNANLALDLADRAYVLEMGRVVLHGPANEMRGDPKVRAAYLGA